MSNTFESDGSAEAAYKDRNLLAQLCGVLAAELGFPVTVLGDDEWPILYIDLPNGQISYHLPLHEVQDGLLGHLKIKVIPPGFTGNPWDGHTLEEKQDRIRRYINDSGVKPRKKKPPHHLERRHGGGEERMRGYEVAGSDGGTVTGGIVCPERRTVTAGTCVAAGGGTEPDTVDGRETSDVATVRADVTTW